MDNSILQQRDREKLQAIGQLAAGIAHEINTPTQYVGDNARFLKQSFEELTQLFRVQSKLIEKYKCHFDEADLRDLGKHDDVDFLFEEIPRAIDQSLEGIDHVAKIVRAMKEFSHPGVEEHTSVDLNRAIENSITVSTNEWKYVADLVTDFDPDLPLVPCIPGEINQVVLNLIINAVHAISDKQKLNGERGCIVVSTRSDHGSAQIIVKDTGSGIPEAIRSRVFEPFFTTKEVGKGTGQGLAIAQATINKHGGAITFETELGIGTSFTIRLPLGRTSTFFLPAEDHA